MGVTETAPGAIIRVDRLTKLYGERTVLQDASFDVAEGEIVASSWDRPAAVRPTLLRCIAGLAEPSEGSISIGGRRKRPS